MQSEINNGALSLDHIAESPCDSLVGRMRAICRGEVRPKHPHTRDAYLEAWLADGTLAADPRDVEANVSIAEQDHSETGKPRKRPENRENDLNRSCRYRGEQTRTVHCKPCELQEGQPKEVPVFACAIHGECTLKRTGKSRLKGCSSCLQGEPVDAEQLLPADAEGNPEGVRSDPGGMVGG